MQSTMRGVAECAVLVKDFLKEHAVIELKQNSIHSFSTRGYIQKKQSIIEMKKIVLFAFNGEAMCFVHVLLNALDMKERGYDARIVMEGAATRLIKQFHDDPSLPFASLYKKVVAEGLVDAVCEACAGKMGAKESAVKQGLRLVKEMSGHPSIAGYLADGYEVMTF